MESPVLLSSKASNQHLLPQILFSWGPRGVSLIGPGILSDAEALRSPQTEACDCGSMDEDSDLQLSLVQSLLPVWGYPAPASDNLFGLGVNYTAAPSVSL